MSRFAEILMPGYRLVPTEDDPELEERAREFMWHWAAGAIYARGKNEEMQCRVARPEPQNAMFKFAVFKRDAFYGVWALVAMRTKALSPGLWEASAEMAPCLPDVYSPAYWREVGSIGQRLLTQPLALSGGGRLELTEWAFPSVLRGDKVEHQWIWSDMQRLETELDALNLAVETEERRDSRDGRNVKYMKRVSVKSRPVAFGGR